MAVYKYLHNILKAMEAAGYNNFPWKAKFSNFLKSTILHPFNEISQNTT